MQLEYLAHRQPPHQQPQPTIAGDGDAKLVPAGRFSNCSYPMCCSAPRTLGQTASMTNVVMSSLAEVESLQASGPGRRMQPSRQTPGPLTLRPASTTTRTRGVKWQKSRHRDHILKVALVARPLVSASLHLATSRASHHTDRTARVRAFLTHTIRHVDDRHADNRHTAGGSSSRIGGHPRICSSSTAAFHPSSFPHC